MSFDAEQLARLITVIEEMAAGNLEARYPLSARHDDLDAIGFCVNVLAEELTATIRRLEEEVAARRAKEAELERAEQQQTRISQELQNLRTARLASIGELAAGVGHEINNPLAYVMGNLEFIEARLERGGAGDPPEQSETLRTMVRESREGAERIRRIVEDLRLFARVDDDSSRVLDVREVMDSALALVANEIRHRATLERDYEDVPAIVASEPRLVQVFVNLLVNAAHALSSGDASNQRIRVAIARAGGDRVLIEIEDSGVGIPEADLPRIFDPFFTSKPPGEGTGLGLPICRELVTKMGGEIGVESEPGVGTTLRVVLPIETAGSVADARAGAAAAETRPSEPRRAMRPLRVLVVDDEPAVARVLCRMLADVDARVVHGGREAIAALEDSDDFDVVFCDLMMPEMSGMNVFETIRARRPRLAERFVFVTGGAFTGRARDFLASVPNPCVHKPFDAREIERAIAEVVASAD